MLHCRGARLQTGMPMTGLAVVGAQYRLSTEDRRLLQAQYIPWAYRAGARCSDLMNVYYERHFEVRRRATPGVRCPAYTSSP